jgi:RHS repeat-associated protein
MPTQTKDFDYGAGAPGTVLRNVLYTYASLGNITAFRQQVTVQNATGTTVAQTNYNYDQGSVQTTSGTPQHTSVTGSRGNLTSTNYYTHGSTYLTSSATYYDTGNTYVATDVNGGTTTYAYGTGSCGNSFPTGVTEAISTLTTSAAWNCTGGVQTSVTDENLQTTSISYTKDPYYWRPESSTDPTNATTSYCYGVLSSGSCTINPKQVEAVLPIVSGSAADALITVDVLGRQRLTQIRQSPSLTTFDTAQTDYDVAGRQLDTRMPFSAAAGVPSSSSPATTISYDALNRPLQVMDGGGGTVNYNYPQNDVYISVVSPSGENAKRRQLEYDALGRLTSVCEVTAGYSGAPAGNCAQNTSRTGYWTKYTYDPLGGLTGVTQNAQAATGYQQTRTYAFDLMGRLTSETNPETTSTAYTYDTDSTCGTSRGDRVKRIDAVGNTTCYAYDALHRLTSATYSGSYSANTPNKYFIYDAATINTSPTTTMHNAKARLAETYTATSVSGTKITDLGFSYTVRGELTNTYQSTQHEAANYYNQLTQTYWANGATDQLSSNITGLPTFTYGVDGEGRPQTASASSGQNPATGTTFNTSSQVTQVTLGSGDSDAFSFDPNTGRMTNYQYNVNSQSVQGALTWNTNSTLQKLVISDPFNSTDSQTCNYVYDDIARLSSANCGSVSGTYAYDAFGNLDKSGSFSFQPLYTNPTTGQNTNRYISIPGATVSYDANGNVLSDGSHAYTWDAEGRPVTIDAVGLTYDALGRMAEQNRSGSYTQIVYAPTGQKLALMSASTLQKAFIPLPGNAQAVYASSGLSYYRHSDWLGSSRFASSPSRAMYSDTAYAPFGEPYAQAGTTDLSYTGQNQDTVAGGLIGPYDFPAREYGPQGRWASPDPSGLAAVDPTNPQSWNRYAYVANNPLGFIDPLGLNMMTDCGGPCFPFYLDLGNGCVAWVSYTDVTDSTGTWAMPSIGVPECPGSKSGLGSGGGGGNSSGGAANNGKLTPPQCKAAQTLLAREQKYGTTIAAWQSAIGYGDGTVEPFNSTNTAPINSPVGPIKVDWYTDLQLAGPFGDPLLYPVAKLTWTGVRLATGAPITNSLPFQDPAESNAWLQSQNPFSTFSSIFTPQFMAQNCPGGGG